MRHARTDYNRRVQDSENLIPRAEPVFLLRAQDSLAADTVDFWADALEAHGGDEDTIDAVRQHANLMRKWSPQKLPTTPQILLTTNLIDEEDGRFMVDLGPPDCEEDPLEGTE